MKKIILSLLIFMVIMANISYADENKKAIVNVTAVRIREAASTESNIVTNVYEDDEVEVLEENGEWYKIKYGSSVGFAKAEFFKMVKSNSQNSETPQESNKKSTNNSQENVATNEGKETNQVASEQPNTTNEVTQNLTVGEKVILPSTVNLRLTPILSSNANITVEQGVEVTIDTKLGNWYKITNQTVSGWTTKSKILTQQPIPQTPPVTEEQPPVVQPPEPEVPQQNTTNAQPVDNTAVEPPKQETPSNSVTENNTTNKMAVVIVETARVRRAATKNSDIIDILDEDDVVTIIGEENDFYKITTNSIKEGYVSKTLVKEKDVTSRGMTVERENVEVAPDSVAAPAITGDDIVSFAKQYLGYPYVLGKSSPESGFDCSGFTRYVFGHFGYKLGQVAASQTSLGTPVDRANLQTGDLILFYDDGKTKIGHCGIYIGGGDFIHSANPQRGVVIDNLNTNSYYAQRFVTARRIIAGTV